MREEPSNGPDLNRLLDDFARLVTDAAGAAQGVRREVETVVKGQIERLMKEMDVATREEVDVLREMVVTRARGKRAARRPRLAALEGAWGRWRAFRRRTERKQPPSDSASALASLWLPVDRALDRL